MRNIGNKVRDTMSRSRPSNCFRETKKLMKKALLSRLPIKSHEQSIARNISRAERIYSGPAILATYEHRAQDNEESSALSESDWIVHNQADHYHPKHRAVDMTYEESVCKYCHREKSCGFFVCDCIGSSGMACIACLDELMRSQEQEWYCGQSVGRPYNPMQCPDCKSRCFGLEIQRGTRFRQPDILMDQMMSTVPRFLILFGPFIALSTLIIDRGLRTVWEDRKSISKLMSLMAIIYLLELLFWTYCYKRNRDNQRALQDFKGVRLTSDAIRIQFRDRNRQ